MPNSHLPHYKRVLLKLSGEALGGDEGVGLNPHVLKTIGQEIKKIHDLGVKIGIVVGAGNIFRGNESLDFNIPHLQGDLIGMESTNINAMVLREVLDNMGMHTIALSALGETKVMDNYTVKSAKSFFEKHCIVICAGGTGNPFSTTDSAAVLRGCELGCDVVLKATKVDGVYTSDPKKDKHAKKFGEISYQDAIAQNLKVMDQTAFTMAKEHGIPIIVFNMSTPSAIVDVVQGKKVGTLVH